MGFAFKKIRIVKFQENTYLVLAHAQKSSKEDHYHLVSYPDPHKTLHFKYPGPLTRVLYSVKLSVIFLHFGFKWSD